MIEQPITREDELSREIAAQRRADWIWAAERSDTFAQAQRQIAIGWASFSLKTALAINGGAAVALLAFFGAVLDKKTGTNAVQALALAGLVFTVGVALAALAGFCAYVSDRLASDTWDTPWDHFKRLQREGEPPDRGRYSAASNVFFWAAVVLWCCSFIAFVTGSVMSYRGFLSL